MDAILDEPAAATKPDARSLLDWYEHNARRLPWRVGPSERRNGGRADPYRVWLSEIMLQQTTVKAVVPYFADFTSRWPTLETLAKARDEDVMAAWAGLGYYSRARNLLACARTLQEEHGGVFPDDAKALRALPGIGAYTSAAIAAIAFDEPAAVVDGNVERVVARLFAIETPLPKARAEITRHLSALVPNHRPGEFAEATMDLGATICTPRRPACALCPWREPCLARALRRQDEFPVKAAKKARRRRYGNAFVALRSDGAVLLRRRPMHGLLGGMAEVPGSAWSDTPPDPADAEPLKADWRMVGNVRHGFTHLDLTLAVLRAELPSDAPAPEGFWWAKPDEAGLPTLFRKVVATATGTSE